MPVGCAACAVAVVFKVRFLEIDTAASIDLVHALFIVECHGVESVYHFRHARRLLQGERAGIGHFCRSSHFSFFSGYEQHAVSGTYAVNGRRRIFEHRDVVNIIRVKPLKFCHRTRNTVNDYQWGAKAADVEVVVKRALFGAFLPHTYAGAFPGEHVLHIFVLCLNYFKPFHARHRTGERRFPLYAVTHYYYFIKQLLTDGHLYIYPRASVYRFFLVGQTDK